MPKKISVKEVLEIPESVDVSVASRVVVVKGPRGSLTKNFKHAQIDIRKDGNNVLIEKWFGNPKEASTVRSIKSHISNMITGVTHGYEYKMKFVYAHFPINASITENDTVLEVRNFIGEKVLRRVQMQEGCKVSRTDNKDEIAIVGNDIQAVSISAAQISQCAIAKRKDIRKFLDGIYVTEKNVIGLE